MTCDNEIINTLLLNSGILFFKHDKVLDEISYDKSKSEIVFPQISTLNRFKYGKEFYRNILDIDRPLLKEFLYDTTKFDSSDTSFIDIRYYYKEDDEVIWLRIQILNSHNDHQDFRYGSIQNITHDKSQLIKTAYAAYTSPLTGLINRERMKKKVALAVSTAQEYNVKHSIIAINIDHLSTINSMFGYQTTNDLIEEVAKVINSIKRKSDILARISSGKFVILLLDTKDMDVTQKGEEFLNAIRTKNFQTCSGIISITASGSGCHIPKDAITSDSTFAILDQCLTIAKKRGRDNFCQYSPDIDNKKQHRENIAISGTIINAVQNNKIHTAYQSILHHSISEKSFMECLARIKNDDGSLVPAYKFISIAESIGFIKHIDLKLLENSIQDLNSFPHLRLSINLSGHTLFNISHNSILMTMLANNKDIANRLCLELTETTALQDIDNLDLIINKIKNLGYKVALDDFGAGYNSFSNLKNFNFDIVKIDGSYIKNISSNKKSQIFVETLTDLAHKLNIEVVAEMIDNQEDLDVIKQIGIDYYQGYFFTEPKLDLDLANKITYPNLLINTKQQKNVI